MKDRTKLGSDHVTEYVCEPDGKRVFVGVVLDVKTIQIKEDGVQDALEANIRQTEENIGDIYSRVGVRTTPSSP